MKVAVTIWDGRVSPVFDVSREALVLTVEEGAETGRCTSSLDSPIAALKVETLLGLGVDTLICGAISEALRHELTFRGVRVIGFVAGNLDEVIQAFLAGQLPARALAMPGCLVKRHRVRRRRRGRARIGAIHRGTS